MRALSLLALAAAVVVAGWPGLLRQGREGREGRGAPVAARQSLQLAPRPGAAPSLQGIFQGTFQGTSQDVRGTFQDAAGLETDRGLQPEVASAARDPEWTNRDPTPPPFTLDPRDLRALADLIAANGLGESSSATDHDDGNGALEPLELGLQRWRGGRLVALLSGEDRYGSFGYGLRLLPPSIADLDALEELDLQTNRLATLPDAIGELRGLRSLRLHRNGLEALPETIGSLRSLRELVVGENALQEIPPAIAGLTSLEELHVNDNPLVALPEAIGLLPRLRILNVSHAGSTDSAQQRLATLPRSLDALGALETLHIAGNRLFCAGGLPDPALAPAHLRDGSIPRLHGLLEQRCAP